MMSFPPPDFGFPSPMITLPQRQKSYHDLLILSKERQKNMDKHSAISKYVRLPAFHAGTNHALRH
ncbi:MAG: hypothetical protein BAA01_10340 [Bacillus thermozeamaize]|uniref:Uncharacterized protein n=1 Tax=Bacillus thermozeamaize TaxID=230954 RepID=A0A1Y3PDS7_9BACI|nr:MAG: hypothetical protein BAA01_10340 [Bacillus thermozeamaize]